MAVHCLFFFQNFHLILEHHKRCWSVIYEEYIGSAWEWCQIKLHTLCDVPAVPNQLRTTVVDGAQSIFAPDASNFTITGY